MSDENPNGENLMGFIASTVETMRDQMVTKSDLEELATKNDLARLETIIRGDFEQVHIRLNSIDRTLSTRMEQIETEMSRLRSVVYLLVKDKPDMLRLLGQSTP